MSVRRWAVITWLPFIILFVFVLIMVAMPWRKPHPNHVFLFEIVKSLPATPKKVAADFTVDSCPCNEPLTIGEYNSSREDFE
jgi:hypothetical protein